MKRIVEERGFWDVKLNYEDVAEFDYQPRACARPYRVVVLRKNLSKRKGELTLLDDIRYFFYITTRTDLSAAEVVSCANERCDQENVIEQLKNGVNAMRVPLYDLVSNWAYMVMATLAWNIKSWMAMMMHRQSDRQEYVRMEFRRFLHSLMLLPWIGSSAHGEPSNAPFSDTLSQQADHRPPVGLSDDPGRTLPLPTTKSRNPGTRPSINCPIPGPMTNGRPWPHGVLRPRRTRLFQV